MCVVPKCGSKGGAGYSRPASGRVMTALRGAMDIPRHSCYSLSNCT
jgi:hypothetical protein